ncbi:MAG: flagellar hook-basal body complex protein FliE [Roseateles sp.]|uniref:flagellar hook-basal body complex protein FliE n=1 Tax=Roseateles sp. TaxID=1971397 RepID=UPI0039E7FD37
MAVNDASMAPSLSSGLLADLARLEQDAQRLVAAAAPGAAAAPAGGFADSLVQALRGVDGQDQDAAQRMTAVETGESDDLVGAMLASQQASLSFSMLMQVRNKVVGAVDELIKLPL